MEPTPELIQSVYDMLEFMSDPVASVSVILLVTAIFGFVAGVIFSGLLTLFEELHWFLREKRLQHHKKRSGDHQAPADPAE